MRWTRRMALWRRLKKIFSVVVIPTQACAIVLGIHDVPARLDTVLHRDDLTLRPLRISVTLPSIYPKLLAPC